MSPFGGYKQSGIGRENGEYGLENFLQVKCVKINVGCNLWLMKLVGVVETRVQSIKVKNSR